MGILQRKGDSGHPSISVKCTKCQAYIPIKGISNNMPVRCPECNYPMICYSDMLSIVSACKNAKESQLSSAVGILRFLADILPEAGTALGYLAKKYTVTMQEHERWIVLQFAYASGDDKAKEWLDLMCRSNPASYGKQYCPYCGAPIYMNLRSEEKKVCVYCCACS